MPELLIRDIEYLRTYGCYPPQSIIKLEASADLESASQFRLLNLTFDPVGGIQTFRDVSKERWGLESKGRRRVDLSFQLESGYYLLLTKARQLTGFPIVITDQQKPARIAVIRPVFAQWTYHANGFYFNEYRAPVDRLLHTIGSIPLVGGRGESGLRQAARSLGIRGVDFPYRAFPANKQVNLGDFYKRNFRWDRSLWDRHWGNIEGLWVDEILSGMPIFAILDRHSIPYHVYSDVDLHDQNPALTSYSALIFSGQEGITSSYYDMLQRLQEANDTAFVLWGVQGFGYRQLEYNTGTGNLEYVATRGENGLWGDKLDGRETDWIDEANLFGFHFPEPGSANWRYDKPYSRIVVTDTEHPLGRTQKSEYRYEVRDLNNESRPGLTWAGGEFQKRVATDAKIIAHLDDDQDVIGIGEYKNTIVFSPTYLPAFFAYQSREHPEIETWFLKTLDYLLA